MQFLNRKILYKDILIFFGLLVLIFSTCIYLQKSIYHYHYTDARSITQIIHQQIPNLEENLNTITLAQNSTQDQLRLINRELQPSIEAISRINPELIISIYSKHLDQVVTRAPYAKYGSKIGSKLPPDHGGHKVCQTGKPLFLINRSLDNELVAKYYTPLSYQGKTIGHLVVMQPVNNYLNRLFYTVGQVILSIIFIITLCLIWINSLEKNMANRLAMLKQSLAAFKSDQSIRLKNNLSSIRYLEEVVQTYNEMADFLEEKISFNNNIIQKTPVGIAVIDPNGVILEVNEVSTSSSKTPRECLIGKCLSDLIELNINWRQWKTKIFEEGQTISYPQLEVIFKNSLEQKYCSVNITPLKDKRGKITSAIILSQDITDVKKLQEQIERSNQLKIIGEIAATAVHEIRNPLAAMRCISQLGLLVKENKEKDRYFETLIKEIDYLNNMLEELIILARKTNYSLESIDLPYLFTNLLKLLQGKVILDQVEISTDFPQDLPPIEGNSTLLKQAFLNLITNSLEAMPKGGKLEIRCKFLTGKNIVLVTIKDTGMGIAKENMDKLFSAFFTTKINGTGLGLPLTYKIIQEDHQGSIYLESQENRGTAFYVELPITKRI